MSTATAVSDDSATTAAPRGLDGRLEAVRNGIAVGWAYDWSNPTRKVDVDILIDGEPIVHTTADMWREMMAREGLDDGCHGFYVELPARLQDEGQHAIAAAFSVSGEPLKPSVPFQSHVTEAAAEWAGTSFYAAPHGDGDGGRDVLRLRSSTQAQFPRRTIAEGFTATEHPETIVLTTQTAVERCEALHFSIQRGVADPEAERRQRFGEHPTDYLAERLMVSRLPGGLVDTSSYLICPTERQFLTDSIRHSLPLARWGYTPSEDGLFTRAVEIEEREERVVALGAQANPNYSHWLVESVVRALLFRPFDDGEVMYLSPPLTDWQREALALVGVEQERILIAPERRMMRFREVYAVSRGITSLPWLIPGALAALAALAEPAAGTQPAPSLQQGERPQPAPSGRQGRRLFVSRARVARRQITNEAELLPVLERHGFETVYPETLSVSEQIALFAGAEVVIGSWGSGLTNLIFSPPGTLVIELQLEDVGYAGNAFVWNIASIRGQRFAQAVCPTAEGMRELTLGRRDVTIDVDQVAELLGELLVA